MAFNQLQANDPRLSWGITKLEILQKLWQQRNITGKGIRIGVLDSGNIPTHPDLGLFQATASDLTAGATDLNPTDDQHGAWCAGVAGANGTSVFGVAPEARLFYGKVKVTSTSVAAGFDWMLNMKPAIQVISVSLEVFQANASPANFEKLRVAVAAAVERGIIVLAAVGNEASRSAEIVERFPAAFPGVIAIGAVKSDFSLHEQSGMNKSIDLLAPGHSLLTTQLATGVKTDFERTSAATAFAAGSVALVLHAVRKNKLKLSSEQLETLLKKTALFPFPNAAQGQSSLFGSGIINPVAAVEEIEKMLTAVTKPT